MFPRFRHRPDIFRATFIVREMFVPSLGKITAHVIYILENCNLYVTYKSQSDSRA